MRNENEILLIFGGTQRLNAKQFANVEIIVSGLLNETFCVLIFYSVNGLSLSWSCGMVVLNYSILTSVCRNIIGGHCCIGDTL